MNLECETLDSLSELTASQLLEQETFLVLYDITDLTERERVKSLLTVRAKELGIEKELKAALKAYDKEDAALNGAVLTLPSYFYKDERTQQLRVSCPKLAQHIREQEHYAFVRNGGQRVANRYWYRDGFYRRVSEDDIKGIIKAYITDHCMEVLKMRDVEEVFRDLITDTTIYEADSVNAEESIINFQNGLLDLRTMQLLPHTPLVLSSIQIPCNWNPDADSAPVFNRFLDELTDGDTEIRELLLEYMGAILSNVKACRFKKALFMVGAGNTGKSQLRALTERILGMENVCSVELPDLENNRFAPAKLLGKRLAGSSDTGFLPVEQMKIFKQTTGGDTIHMERKGVDGFDGHFDGFFWFCMNELPRFGGDRGAWVYERIMIVRCDNVIPPERQDKQLCDKMYAERETIVRMAIEAFSRAVKRGYKFAEPDSVISERAHYEVENNPVLKFFFDCCEMRDGSTILDEQTTRTIRSAYKSWCADNRYIPVASQRFNKEISDHLKCSVEAIQTRTSSARFYTFKLTDEARRDYLYHSDA